MSPDHASHGAPPNPTPERRPGQPSRPAPSFASALLPDRRLLWPAICLLLLLLFNLLFTNAFFTIEIRDHRFYGVPIDILKHGSRVMLLALGMTLVIATGGVDLSVGAVMAIAGAVAAVVINRPEQSFPLAVAAALLCSLVAGVWNGLLVGVFRIQPIVATLVLMVAGRGVAQLITDGQIVTFTSPALVYLGNGRVLGLPFPIVLVGITFLFITLAIRRTSLGLFLEAVGDSPTASRFAGINPAAVKILAYACAGLCAGLAGLVAAADIRGADSNHAGRFLELDAILAVVIGGASLSGGRISLVGSLLGALLIQTLTTTMYMRDVSADVATVPKALVVILVCLAQSPEFRRLLHPRAA